MSQKASDAETCAACGKAGVDEVKLKNCAACKIVKYCGVACQKAHRWVHKKECKKRAAELHDEKLFSLPQKEDCPICFLPFHSSTCRITYLSCCGQFMCSGCILHENELAAADGRSSSCPFCRRERTVHDNEIAEDTTNRMELNDPMAFYMRGRDYWFGLTGFEKDIKKALEAWERGVELGSAEACHYLGDAYFVEKEGIAPDLMKAIRYYELAIIRGNVASRSALGLIEYEANNLERAKKHFVLGARSGYKPCLDIIQHYYASAPRFITKVDFERALHAYKEAVDEMKSEPRGKVESFERNNLL